MDLLYLTVPRLIELLNVSDAATASEINELLLVINKKKPNPDKILKNLEKQNRLKDFVDYYSKMLSLDLQQIQQDLKENKNIKPYIEIIISMHILLNTHKKSKIKWPPWAQSVSVKKKLITRKELADILGTSKANITKLCKKKFKHAVQPDKKIDLNDPIIQEHIAERKARLKSKESPKPVLNEKNDNDTSISNILDHDFNAQIEIDFSKIESLTVREVVERYGNISGFKVYIDSLKIMAEWKNKEVKYLHSRKNLIEIEPLATTLFSLIDLTYKRIIGEYPLSVTSQLRAIAISNKKDANIEMIELQEKTLSKIIKDCKKEIINQLKIIKNN